MKNKTAEETLKEFDLKSGDFLRDLKNLNLVGFVVFAMKMYADQESDDCILANPTKEDKWISVKEKLPELKTFWGVSSQMMVRQVSNDIK